LGSTSERSSQKEEEKNMDYCLCMLPVLEEYLKSNTVYNLIAVAESDFLLQSHEWKYLLSKMGYVSNAGCWTKQTEPSALK